MQKFVCQQYEDGIASICLPVTTTVVRNVEVTKCKSFNFGSALEAHYYILEHVFEYLEIKDLQLAKEVNDTWKSLAEKELGKRVSSCSLKCYRSNSYIYVDITGDYKYNDIAFCMVSYIPKIVKLQKSICLHDIYADKKKTFSEYLKKDIVPKNVKYWVIADMLPQIVRLCLQNSKLYIYSALYIPYIPNIEIEQFCLQPKCLDSPLEFIKPNREMLCTLVFGQVMTDRLIQLFHTNILKRFGSDNLAFGGGKVPNLVPFQRDLHKKKSDKHNIYCICFLKEKGVEVEFNAYSVVIPQSMRDEQLTEFSKVSTNLKAKCVLRQHGIIFRFCCYAYQYPIKEEELLQNAFSNYRIFSLCVSGEIGKTSGIFEDDSEENPHKYEFMVKRKKEETLLMWGYTTVLVLVTWGKEISQ